MKEFKENDIVRLNSNRYEDERHRGKYWTVIKEVGDDLIKCRWKDDTEYFYRIDLELIKTSKMTEERFIEIFENTESELEVEVDSCFEGLKIISKYTHNIVCGAGDDEVWSEDVDTLIEKGITEEDVVALAKLNWRVEDNTYLACSV